MANPLTSPSYDPCRTWIQQWIEEGKSPEEIRYGLQDNDAGLDEFLRSQKKFNFWPADLDRERWFKLVDAMEQEWQLQINIETQSIAAQIVDVQQLNKVSIPSDKRSAWQIYRTHLLEDAGFTPAAVNNLQTACGQTMRVLSTATAPDEPRRGLIIGNVQSGKTANMAGLMALSADAGFNVFVILSGTIENLRVQTQERLFSDLNCPKRPSRLNWQIFNHPALDAPVGARTQDLKLGADSYARYMTVCLKNADRLEALKNWLWDDANQLERMRILLIDDEADQASIDTSNHAKSAERTTINRLITDLVYGPQRTRKTAAYGAMNYVSYTATPYANCLNEAGPGSLYPQDFIQTLATPRSYFGPDKLFPTPGGQVDGTLEMYREIPKEDAQIVQAIYAGKATEIPESLQRALLWFFCVCGIMRHYKYAHPVTILIHTSQSVDHHGAVAAAVTRWIVSSKEHLVEWCRELYAVERLRVTHASLRAVYPDYEYPDSEIWGYPEFDEIVPHIEDVIAGVSRIYMDGGTGTLRYGKSVHLCIDNCQQNGTDETGAHMRLAYPTADQQSRMGFAPAFIVIGGNTLSRGLTLQGLVVTFFLRTVRQADSLMQMGRWFGYRRHYELFPRIWMTADTYDKFSLLAAIDYDLRIQIQRMQQLGQTPAEFPLTIITSPMVTWLRLTSPAKMQAAEIASVDFRGTVTQLTVYDTAEDVLRGNLQCADSFLATLGTPEKSALTAAFYWTDVSYDDINANLFGSGFRIAETSRAFQQLEFLNQWVVEQTKNGKMTKWTVIACGLEYIEDETPPDRVWRLPDDCRLCTVSRTARTVTDSAVNIGVLASRRDFLADITPEMVNEADWDSMKKTPSSALNCNSYREKAGVSNTPLLLLYRIYRKSQKRPGSNRRSLDLDADAIGLAMVCPGVRSGRESTQRVQLSRRLFDAEWEVDTGAD